VGRNHLNEFPRDAIATLKNLNQLDLSENKIGLLKPGDFQGREKSTGGLCISFSVAFTVHLLPPSHHGSVWLIPVNLSRGCGLANPYDWRGFFGAKRKTSVGLLEFYVPEAYFMHFT
jgi:hypothetical protein